MSRWCHLTISSFVAPFSSCLQSFPASGSFSNKSALQVRWPKYWSCSISPSNEYSGLLTKTLYFDETLISLLRALDWTRDDLGLPSPSLQNPVWVRVLWSQFSENSPKVSGYPRYHADIRLACLKQGFCWVSLARSPLPMITPLSHFHPLIHILPLRYGSPLSLLESEFSLVSLPYHKPHLSSLTVSVCMCIHAKSLQSCLTLCNPIDCSPPGFSVHGILPTRILEWVAILSSRGSNPHLLHLLPWQAGSLPLVKDYRHNLLLHFTFVCLSDIVCFKKEKVCGNSVLSEDRIFQQ